MDQGGKELPLGPDPHPDQDVSANTFLLIFCLKGSFVEARFACCTAHPRQGCQAGIAVSFPRWATVGTNRFWGVRGTSSLQSGRLTSCAEAPGPRVGLQTPARPSGPDRVDMSDSRRFKCVFWELLGKVFLISLPSSLCTAFLLVFQDTR